MLPPPGGRLPSEQVSVARAVLPAGDVWAGGQRAEEGLDRGAATAAWAEGAQGGAQEGQESGHSWT